MIEKNKKYVVTGGYGFLGSNLIEDIINKGGLVRTVGKNIIKLNELKEKYGDNIEIIQGDIYNLDTVKILISDDIKGVFHLAAFKYVSEAEKKVIECINTNVIGTMNILNISSNIGVEFVLGVTGAAAVQISGTYGATKLLTEKLFFHYQKLYPEINFRILRYGNILYSTGSVLCKWKNIISNGGDIVITDGDATRFFSTIEEAVQLIYDCLKYSEIGKPYIPKLKSISINDLLNAMLYKYKSDNVINISKIGMQVGENKHEKIDENGLNSFQSEHFTFDEIINLI